jgi:hypothetical protein
MLDSLMTEKRGSELTTLFFCSLNVSLHKQVSYESLFELSMMARDYENGILFSRE